MPSSEYIRARGARAGRKTVLERHLNKVLDELSALERFPETDDDIPVGSVIRFEKQFEPGGTIYSYAAIKVASAPNYGQFGPCWFTTGPRSPMAYTWTQLVEWMSAGVTVREIEIATEWQSIMLPPESEV